MNEAPTTCPVRHDFDPLDPAHLVDPYVMLGRLRDETPVCWSPVLDMYVVARIDDVESVLMDPASFSGRIVQNPVFGLCDEARAILSGTFHPLPVMSNNDPPDHTRIRTFTSRAFSPRRIAALEPYVRERAAEYVEAMLAGPSPAEFVSSLAYPLPARTVFRLIGFPERDADQLKAWCGRRMLFSWGRPTSAEQVDIARDMVSYWTYCQEFVDAKVAERARGTTTDDVVSELLAAHEDDPAQIRLDEVKSVVYGLSFAGHEAVTNLLSNALVSLLGHGEAWHEVCADTSLVADAGEEVIRQNNSQLSWRRVADRDTEVGGVMIPAGATVHLLLGAANRDPERFENADRFDIHRPNARRNVSFGKGIHLCLGSAMARMEARVVVETIATRMPDLRLADRTLRYPANVQFRGPTELWVEWGAAS